MQDREIMRIWRNLVPRIAETDNRVTIKLKGQSFAFIKPKTETSTNTKRYLGYGR